MKEIPPLRHLYRPERSLPATGRNRPGLPCQTRILVLDEPTSVVGDRDGGSVHDPAPPADAERRHYLHLHRLEEILRLADRITVLRDGSIRRHPAHCGYRAAGANPLDGRSGPQSTFAATETGRRGTERPNLANRGSTMSVLTCTMGRCSAWQGSGLRPVRVGQGYLTVSTVRRAPSD
jgi:energy-coupling factor transporter ATP-binding protein EcfA2